MAGDLGRWMNSVSDIKKAEELNKKPPIFKKLFDWRFQVEEVSLANLHGEEKSRRYES